GGTATFVKAPRCERMTAHGACSAPPQPSAGANRAWRPRVAQCGMACVRRNYIVGTASDLSRRGSRDADDIGARGAPTTPDPALDSGPPWPPRPRALVRSPRTLTHSLLTHSSLTHRLLTHRLLTHSLLTRSLPLPRPLTTTRRLPRGAAARSPPRQNPLGREAARRGQTSSSCPRGSPPPEPARRL